MKSRRFARGLAVTYVLALVLVSLLMRFIGEHSVVTTLMIYLPRLGFLLPMPFVAGLAWATGEKRVASFTTAASILIVVFPLMGWHLGHASSEPQALRVMTWNTFFGRNDNDAIYRDVMEEQPDIFVAQATAHRTKDLFRADPKGYNLSADEEFFLATKFPIVDRLVSTPMPDDPGHTAAFVRYTLSTPHGLVDVFDIHPRSPRDGIEKARGRGFRDKIADLGLLGESARHVANNTHLRRRQVETLLEVVKQAQHPVIIAGDTNLPTSSWLFHHAFDDTNLTDAFDAVGGGFGYTFPAKRPWMRIDRILTDPTFRALRVRAAGNVASDHRYLIGDFGYR